MGNTNFEFNQSKLHQKIWLKIFAQQISKLNVTEMNKIDKTLSMKFIKYNFPYNISHRNCRQTSIEIPEANLK